ncbi:MAG: sporulation protein YtfJ, partial [Ruminococcus sp.]|nr:sporulation protein YtfJ [Ruminococcus sp.]
AGVSIKPEGFLVISPDGTAKMVSVDSGSDPISTAINAAPNVINKITGIMNKKKKKDSDAEVILND